MCVSTLCGKTFCTECFENCHSCSKADIEKETLRLQNSSNNVTPTLPVNPFFQTPNQASSQRFRPTTTKRIINRKSQRITEDREDDEDSDYVHREKKDIESSDEDDDSEFSELEGQDAREAYIKRKLNDGMNVSLVKNVSSLQTLAHFVHTDNVIYYSLPNVQSILSVRTHTYVNYAFGS